MQQENTNDLGQIIQEFSEGHSPSLQSKYEPPLYFGDSDDNEDDHSKNDYDDQQVEQFKKKTFRKGGHPKKRKEDKKMNFTFYKKPQPNKKNEKMMMNATHTNFSSSTRGASIYTQPLPRPKPYHPTNEHRVQNQDQSKKTTSVTKETKNKEIERIYSQEFKQTRQSFRPHPHPHPPPAKPSTTGHQSADQHLKMVGKLLQICEQIWVFYIQHISVYYEQKIKNLYRGIIKDQQIHTLCKTQGQFLNFFNPNNPKCIINIVMSYEYSIRPNNPYYKHKDKIGQMIIYHHDEAQMRKIQRQKLLRPSEKKQNQMMTSDLDYPLQLSDSYIELYRRFWEGTDQEETIKQEQKFVSYIKINRFNMNRYHRYLNIMYSGKNLDIFQLPQVQKQFNAYSIEFIKKYCKQNQQQQSKVRRFYNQHIQHNGQFDIANMKDLINQYKKQTYFHKIINIKLRTFRNFNDYRKICLPYFQLYHTIHAFYRRRIQYQIEQPRNKDIWVYRGCKFAHKQFTDLRKGDYINTTGFLSTSTSKTVALRFCDPDAECKYFLQIRIPPIRGDSKYDGGGFALISDILTDENIGRREYQILFNPLNIFRVDNVDEERDGEQLYKYVTLSYGAIMELSMKKFKTKEELQILQQIANLKALQNDSDQGDMHIYNRQYKKAIDHYQEKIRKYKNTTDPSQSKVRKNKIAGYTIKLSETYRLNNQLDKAQEEVKKFLDDEENLERGDQDLAMKVYVLHLKKIQLQMEEQRLEDAQKQINIALSNLEEGQFEEKFNLLMKRAQIRFKKGRITQAQDDFNLIDTQLNTLINNLQTKKDNMESKCEKIWNWLICSSEQEMRQNEEAKRQKQQQIVEQQHKLGEMIKKHTKRCQWMSEKIVQNAKKYNINKDEYKVYVNKGYNYLQKLRERMADDPRQKMKYEVQKAQIDNYNDKADSEETLKTIKQYVNNHMDDESDQTKCYYHKLMIQIEDKQWKMALRKNKVVNPVRGKFSLSMKRQDRQHYEEVYAQIQTNYKQAIRIMEEQNRKKDIIELKTKMSTIGDSTNIQQSFDELLQLRQKYKDLRVTQLVNLMIMLADLAIQKGQIRFALDEINWAQEKMRDVIIKGMEAEDIHNEIKIQQLYYETSEYNKIKLMIGRIYIRLNKYEKFDEIMKSISGVEKKLRKVYKDEIFKCEQMIKVEQLKARIYFKQKNLPKTLFHYKNVIKIIKNLGQKSYYQLGKVYCDMAKYFFHAGDFLFGMKYMILAEKSERRKPVEHPNTWPLYYLFYMHKKYQQRLSYSDSQRMEQLISHSMCFIDLAHRLSQQVVDPLNIRRFQIRAGYFLTLMQRKQFLKGFNYYKNLFNDLFDNIIKSQGYKEILKPEDDQKLLFLMKIIQIFLGEYRKNSFNDFIDIDELQAERRNSEHKLQKIKKLQFTQLLPVKPSSLVIQ